MAPPIARSHALLPHTADAGLRAEAADLAGVLEEAALALADLTADGASTAPVVAEPVELAAPDLPALAFAWLNELVGLIDARAAALARADVQILRPTADGWRLHGRAWLAAVDGVRVRRRADVKSATYHGLEVEAIPGGWRLVAYVDI